MFEALVTKKGRKKSVMFLYVLYCQTLKTEKICKLINQTDGMYAFIPKMEKYIGSIDQVVDDVVMFPGYLFIETEWNQIAFDTFLYNHGRKDGIIKELKKDDVSALTDDEACLLKNLLDNKGILRMSEGIKEHGKSIVCKGPLRLFQEHIVDVNVKDRLAILNVEFLNRKIKAGLYIKQNIEI